MFTCFEVHVSNSITSAKTMSTRGEYTLLQYILHWLRGPGWHWILLLVYAAWWAQLQDARLSEHKQGEKRPTTDWLRRRGSLRSVKDARNLLIFHVILLVLEPVEGYWILISWYRTFSAIYWMQVPDSYTWGDTLVKYWCNCLFPIGLLFWSLLGIDLMLLTWAHVQELRALTSLVEIGESGEDKGRNEE